MQAIHSLREIAALVPMRRVLEALGIEANERKRRCACVLHGGSNPSAFAWREDGRWRCFSCGASGDRIALVRTVRQCSFHEAVDFLAELVGVSYSARHPSETEIERARLKRERATLAAWRVRDEVIRLRAYYCDGLHRSERLWQRLGHALLRAQTENEREAVWDRMARLAPVQTFFLAAFEYLNRADTATLTRVALALPPERRTAILGDNDGNVQLQAA
jgi:DNA primase